MQRLGVVDFLCCPLNTFAPRLASVRQPRQRTTLQNIQKLWLLLQTQKKTRQNLTKYRKINSLSQFYITEYVNEI